MFYSIEIVYYINEQGLKKKYLDSRELLEDSHQNTDNVYNEEILDNVMSQITTKNELYNALSEADICYNDTDERFELKKILRNHFNDHLNSLNNITSPRNF